MVVVCTGSGTASQLRSFNEEMQFKGEMLTDPELGSFKAVGLTNGFFATLSWYSSKQTNKQMDLTTARERAR